MMCISKVAAALVFLSMAACVPRVQSVYLIDGADKVKVFRKNDPPAACKEISPFSAVSGNGCGVLGTPGTYESAYNTFRNRVVEMGGNAGLIENEVTPHGEPGCYVNSYIMNGVAYNCPESALQ